MKYLKKLFGILSPVEKKQKELDKLRLDALKAQRSGDLREAGRIYFEIEKLETEIVDLLNEGG